MNDAAPIPDPLLMLVGDRVRRARARLGVSRRVLSERSGVSPRYLAQLEGGGGNISIVLLQRVAEALDLRIETLVGAEEDAASAEAMQVAALYRRADRETRETVMAALASQPSAERRAQRVCLIGLRGAGKSTLGRMAGAALDAPFVELNREIEAQLNMPIGEIVALYEQDGYRRLESEALARVIESHDRLILAVAGGIVGQPETFETLLSHFHTIWLIAEPEEHMDRVRAQGDERPMAGNPEAMAQLRAILATREPHYGRAEARLDTSGELLEASHQRLIDLISAHGFLDGAAGDTA